jgi:hypothetical protein
LDSANTGAAGVTTLSKVTIRRTNDRGEVLISSFPYSLERGPEMHDMRMDIRGDRTRGGSVPSQFDKLNDALTRCRCSALSVHS